MIQSSPSCQPCCWHQYSPSSPTSWRATSTRRVLERPGERGEQVWEFGVERAHPCGSVGLHKVWRGLAQEGETPRGQAVLHGVAVGIPRQALACVLAHGLEHQQAVTAAHQQLLRDERVQRVQRGARHAFGRRHRGASGECRQVCKRSALGIGEKTEAPVDRRAQRALALWSVAHAAGQRR